MINTRPSNVRVCRFRHSRICSVRNVDYYIRGYYKCQAFFEIFLIIFFAFCSPYILPGTGAIRKRYKKMNNEQYRQNSAVTIASLADKKHCLTNTIHYSLINAPDRASKGIMVPVTGLEPVRCCHRGILSPLRLPISPHRHKAVYPGSAIPIYPSFRAIIVY